MLCFVFFRKAKPSSPVDSGRLRSGDSLQLPAFAGVLSITSESCDEEWANVFLFELINNPCCRLFSIAEVVDCVKRFLFTLLLGMKALFEFFGL